MKYSNLKNSKEYVEKTINLIENAFNYTKEHSFNTDFYPLMKESNHKNCHILIDNDVVVAHIGALTHQLKVKNKIYSFTMFGGIAVSDKYRGKGLFKKLFNEVIHKYQDQAFYLLWSEKTQMYEKFDFYPCGQLNQYESNFNNSSYTQSNFKELSKDDLKQIKNLYNSENELRPIRKEKDWNELASITSTDLYLKKEDNIIKNYFFKNKGADLTNIIHEYGNAREELTAYGSLWTPKNLNLTPIYLNAFLLKPGAEFKDFIFNYCQIEIEELTENSKFIFQKQNYEMSKAELLAGIFGPGRFEELSCPFIFIPGVTSI